MKTFEEFISEFKYSSPTIKDLGVNAINYPINIDNYMKLRDCIINCCYQIERTLMPQIYQEDLNDFVKYLNGLAVYTKIKVSDLKPIQDNIYIDKVINKNINELKNTNLIVSSDNYIIDGHHRWAAVYLDNPEHYQNVLYPSFKVEELFLKSLEFSKMKGNHES